MLDVKVLNYIQEQQKTFVEGLCALLEIPSVSTQVVHAEDMKKCAELVAASCSLSGLENVKVVQTKGSPLVYADWLHAPGKPTFLFYGHYDVQPPEPLELWDSPPFQPRIVGDELFARGASDNKGQFWMVLKTLEAFLKTHKKLPVNVKILIEGEEESGGTACAEFVRENSALLAADTVIVFDSTFYDYGMPTLNYNLRGVLACELEIYGPSTDLHSGLYGGMVPNPGNILIQILSSMQAENGEILIDRFYEDVRPISDFEKEMFASLPFNAEKILQTLGVKGFVGEVEYPPMARTWVRPAFDVHGILCGYTEPGHKSIIPSKAMAKFGFRLVPRQTPRKIITLLQAHLEKVIPASIRWDLKIKGNGAHPYETNLDSPYLKSMSVALEKGFGAKTVLVGGGGSIPIVSTFKDALNVETLLGGIGVPDDHAHAPNEKLNLVYFRKGMESLAHFLSAYD